MSALPVDELRALTTDGREWAFIEETLACLDARAFRAAYVMAWLTCAEALRSRLEEMAAGHQQLGRDLHQALEGRSVDERLLGVAETYGYLAKHEVAQLRAILQSRNTYGHPTGRQPAPYEIEHAIQAVVRIVLARPAQHTAGTARELAERAATDPHFLYSDEKAVREWADKYSQLIHPNARGLFLRELLGRLPVKDRALRDRVVTIAGTMIDAWDSEVDYAQCRISELVPDRLEVVVRVFANPQRWRLVPIEDRPFIVQRLLQGESRVGFGELLSLLRLPAYAETPEAHAIRHWAQTAPFPELSSGWSGRPIPEAFERIRHRLLESNGYAAWEAGQVLDRARTEDITALTADQQRELAQALYRAATDGGSYRAADLVRELQAEEPHSAFHEVLHAYDPPPERS